MSEAPYPEPKGYVAKPGFVKSNPLNNDYYVQEWEGHPWYHIIKHTHDTLTARYPGYNIVQIKEKFGGLRYYVDRGTYVDNPDDPEWMQWSGSRNIILYAEAWVDGFEWSAKHED